MQMEVHKLQCRHQYLRAELYFSFRQHFSQLSRVLEMNIVWKEKRMTPMNVPEK
jgi:hypothetical protein